jgi:membrane protease YdiL (CAAX protease family)
MEPPPYSHPGSPAPRPEVPEGLPLAWSVPPPRHGAPADEADALPPWPPWSPLAGMAMAFVAALLAFLVLTVIAELAGGDVDEDAPAVNIGATVAQDLALIAAAVILARLLAPHMASAWHFGLRRVRFWPAVGWIALAWLGFFAFAFLWEVLVGPEPQDDLPSELGADESDVALVAVALLVCVLAPIAEEFFFRGFFFTAMRRWVGMIPGAILTGIVFGGIHAGGTPLELLVVLAVFGFLLCLLYVWTGSLIPCIVLHALNNSIALGVSQDWGWEIPLLMAGSTALCLALTLPLARRSPRPGAPAPS